MRVTRRKRMTAIFAVITGLFLIANIALYFINDYYHSEQEVIENNAKLLETQILKAIERNDFISSEEKEPYEKLQSIIPATERFEEFIVDDLKPIIDAKEITLYSINYESLGLVSEAVEIAAIGSYKVNKISVTIEGASLSEKDIADSIKEILDLERTVIISNYDLIAREEITTFSLTMHLYYLIDKNYEDALPKLLPGVGDYKDYLTE